MIDHLRAPEPRLPRSLHVISSLMAGAGGPSRSVTALCDALNGLGAKAVIATVATDDAIGSSGGTDIWAFPPSFPRMWWRSKLMARWLEDHLSEFDVLHIHGLWQWPGVASAAIGRSKGIPAVVSARGMAEPWALAQGPLKKKLAWWLWERQNFTSAALLHATSASEATQFRNLGLQNPIAIIPNGLEFPPISPTPKASPRKVLYLSRLHPKKGLDLLLRAWAELSDHEGWALELVGPDSEGHRAELESLATSLCLQDSVSFHAPQYGEAKWSLLRESSLVILPSHSENFGNVVVEALSQGVPVIASQGTPWQGLVANGCGWWPPTTVGGIQDALASAIALGPAALAAMGQRGSVWARSAFSAEVTAQQMLRQYQDTLALFRPHL